MKIAEAPCFREWRRRRGVAVEPRHIASTNGRARNKEDQRPRTGLGQLVTPLALAEHVGDRAVQQLRVAQVLNEAEAPAS